MNYIACLVIIAIAVVVSCATMPPGNVPLQIALAAMWFTAGGLGMWLLRK